LNTYILLLILQKELGHEVFDDQTAESVHHNGCWNVVKYCSEVRPNQAAVPERAGGKRSLEQYY
jgi:hypothetical protein